MASLATVSNSNQRQSWINSGRYSGMGLQGRSIWNCHLRASMEKVDQLPITQKEMWEKRDPHLSNVNSRILSVFGNRYSSWVMVKNLLAVQNLLRFWSVLAKFMPWGSLLVSNFCLRSYHSVHSVPALLVLSYFLRRFFSPHCSPGGHLTPPRQEKRPNVVMEDPPKATYKPVSEFWSLQTHSRSHNYIPGPWQPPHLIAICGILRSITFFVGFQLFSTSFWQK